MADKQFAKLFDTACGQFLVTIENGSSDEDGPCIKFRGASIQGVSPEIIMGPWSDDDAGWSHVETVLADFDQSQAEEQAISIANTVKGFLA